MSIVLVIARRATTPVFAAYPQPGLAQGGNAAAGRDAGPGVL